MLEGHQFYRDREVCGNISCYPACRLPKLWDYRFEPACPPDRIFPTFRDYQVRMTEPPKPSVKPTEVPMGATKPAPFILKTDLQDRLLNSQISGVSRMGNPPRLPPSIGKPGILITEKDQLTEDIQRIRRDAFSWYVNIVGAVVLAILAIGGLAIGGAPPEWAVFLLVGLLGTHIFNNIKPSGFLIEKPKQVPEKVQPAPEEITYSWLERPLNTQCPNCQQLGFMVKIKDRTPGCSYQCIYCDHIISI